MNEKSCKDLGTYMKLYVFLAEKPHTRDECMQHLLASGIKDATARAQVRKAEKGELSFIAFEEGQLHFKANEFEADFSAVCKTLGENVTFSKSPNKKTKPEDLVPSVVDPHCPDYIDMKNAQNKKVKALQDQIKELEVKNAEDSLRYGKRACDRIRYSLKDKRLVTGTMEVKPLEQFDRDFFLLSKPGLLDTEDLISRFGGEMQSPYEPVFSEVEVEKELTEKNYLEKLLGVLHLNKLLKDRVEEQERLPEVKQKEKENDGWVKRNAITPVEIEKNRLDSINEIMSSNDLPNQAKLVLYAAWCDKSDVELQKLLNLAGELGIEANYVIRLLEKPREYHNYRTMRGMLLQAKKGSEAHIKREAAMELICGEWYVEAEYAGEMTRFQMVPVSELNAFKYALEEYKTEAAVEALNKMLSGNKKNLTKKTAKELLEELPLEEAEFDPIEKPDFMTKKEKESGVDCHAPVDEDKVMDDFSEERSVQDAK